MEPSHSHASFRRRTLLPVARRRSNPQSLGLGPLEAEIMRVLWRRGPSLGAQVERELNRRRTPPLAYTTVINVLSNLETKGVVRHEQAHGRAYRFSPVCSEDELRELQAAGRVRDIFDVFKDEAVSAIVDQVRENPVLLARFRELLEPTDVADRS
jgi:predicted transcriptional regulator